MLLTPLPVPRAWGRGRDLPLVLLGGRSAPQSLLCLAQCKLSGSPRQYSFLHTCLCLVPLPLFWPHVGCYCLPLTAKCKNGHAAMELLELWVRNLGNQVVCASSEGICAASAWLILCRVRDVQKPSLEQVLLDCCPALSMPGLVLKGLV